MANQIPPAAIWHGPPTPERVREIQERDYPEVGDWIYQRQPDGTYKRWQFIGTYKRLEWEAKRG